MLSRIVLDYERDPEVIDQESLFKYDGKKDFEGLLSMEAIADTRQMSLCYLGDLFPNLEKLRLNNSRIPTIRDVSASLTKLRFLSLADCGISCLDGIGTLSTNLEELYLAFNQITDMSELMTLSKLRVLDLEENQITNIDDVEFLSCCQSLRALTLARNPAAESESYRTDVMMRIPHLVYLDEKRLRTKPRQPPGNVTIVPLEIKKIPKGEKCATKPKSAEGTRSELQIFTEQLAEEAERPPTARAYQAMLPIAPKGKKIVTPKFGRPRTSHQSRRYETAELFE
jgi:Leucine-rich repeat (LRR) protein